MHQCLPYIQKQQGPQKRALLFRAFRLKDSLTRRLVCLDVRSLKAFLALSHFEGDLLAFLQ